MELCIPSLVPEDNPAKANPTFNVLRLKFS